MSQRSASSTLLFRKDSPYCFITLVISFRVKLCSLWGVPSCCNNSILVHTSRHPVSRCIPWIVCRETNWALRCVTLSVLSKYRTLRGFIWFLGENVRHDRLKTTLFDATNRCLASVRRRQRLIYLSFQYDRRRGRRWIGSVHSSKWWASIRVTFRRPDNSAAWGYRVLFTWSVLERQWVTRRHLFHLSRTLWSCELINERRCRQHHHALVIVAGLCSS